MTSNQTRWPLDQQGAPWLLIIIIVIITIITLETENDNIINATENDQYTGTNAQSKAKDRSKYPNKSGKNKYKAFSYRSIILLLYIRHYNKWHNQLHFKLQLKCTISLLKAQTHTQPQLNAHVRKKLTDLQLRSERVSMFLSAGSKRHTKKEGTTIKLCML